MIVLQVFLVGAVVSFLGSVPPGTLNLLVLQLGMQNKIKAALRFALAVAIIEYPYAWIAVVFEQWITASPVVQDNFHLIGATVMTLLGVLGIWSARKPGRLHQKFEDSGFRRGLVLSILNPQAIPWWIAMTAGLKLEGWIVLDTSLQLHAYLLGTAIGALVLLILLAVLAKKAASRFQDHPLVRLLPGVILLVLGLVGLATYFW
ncbi:MAG: LysE family transporter [Cyclobacteriaceae bacterium]